MHRSYSGCSALVRSPSASARSSIDGPRSVSPSGTNTSGRSAALGAARGRAGGGASASRSTSSHRYGTWLRARNVLISWLRSDQRWPTTRTPPSSSTCSRRQSLKQVVEHRVEPLLGRIPRLQQVVVEAEVVDRLDRDVGVGVRGEQHELRLGRVRTRLLEELDAGHLRHALVGRDQRDRALAQRELGEHRRAPPRPTSRARSGTRSRTGGAGRA